MNSKDEDTLTLADSIRITHTAVGELTSLVENMELAILGERNAKEGSMKDALSTCEEQPSNGFLEDNKAALRQMRCRVEACHDAILRISNSLYG